MKNNFLVAVRDKKTKNNELFGFDSEINAREFMKDCKKMGFDCLFGR